MRMINFKAGRFTLLAAAGTCLSACTVGPTFKPPEGPSPAAYLSPQESSYARHLEKDAGPAADWWRAFDSSQIDALVAAAIADNETLVAARARVAEARELVRAEGGRRFPQVSLDGGAGRQKYGKQFLGSFIDTPPFSYVAAGATVSYSVDYVGGIARSVEERRALAQYQRSEADATYLSLTGSVVTEAIEGAAAQTELRAAAELLAEDRRNLDLVRSAYRDGSVSRVDVVTAESQLATDQTLLPPLRQQVSLARHALAVLTGRPPAESQSQPLSLSGLTLPSRLPLSLPSSLAHRRPDILAAEAQLHAATAAVGVATANLYPQITLTATGGWQSVAGQSLFEHSNAAWSLISGLTAPLFDGGTLRAERRASLDELQASAAEYQEVVLESFGQVANVLAALQHDSELITAQSNALQAAQSSVRLARESYSAGNTGLLQVLDAQRQRISAQLGILRAEAQQYSDTTQLFLALGGGASQEVL
jgi:NodT family efflux transporter outer membrane factor (OMF) lipoprotein